MTDHELWVEPEDVTSDVLDQWEEAAKGYFKVFHELLQMVYKDKPEMADAWDFDIQRLAFTYRALKAKHGPGESFVLGQFAMTEGITSIAAITDTELINDVVVKVQEFAMTTLIQAIQGDLNALLLEGEDVEEITGTD